MKPRLLKGHERTATCCIASQHRPGLIASSGEDGRVCLFDLRCPQPIFAIGVGSDPVASLCFKGGNEDIIYVSCGSKISCFDIHNGSSWKPLETYNFNKDEINQIAFTSKSYFLAAADDTGEVKLIDTRQQQLYKTLRGVHTSICSSVQFLPWKPWTVITGGLDSKIVMWDFSKGRPCNILDYGASIMDTNNACSSGQFCNPPFVHAVAVLETDLHNRVEKVCAVARGDGIVEIIDMEPQLFAMKSNGSTRQAQGRSVQLDYSLGGHSASVSCVSFSLFGERGMFLISGGNDASVKLWDWSKHFDAEQTSCSKSLHLSFNMKRKVNWLCTTPANNENLIVCDTSRVLKVYTVS